MEGDYDPSHAGFLHSKLEDMQIVNPLNQDALTLFRGEGEQAERFPRAVGTRRVGAEFGRRIGGTVEDNDSGIFIVMASEAADGKKSAFVMPWMTPIFCTAGIQGPNSYSSNMRIPIDNRSLMFYRLRWSYSPLEEKELNEYKHGEYYYPALIPGSWKTRENVANDYGVDRVAQKYFTYTGIKSFPLQDIAMMENQWGPLADRTREHLTSMDHQIIYVRRRLLRTAKALAEGIEPSEPFHPEAYAYHTASVTLESGTLDEALSAARAESMRMHLAPARVAPAITT